MKKKKGMVVLLCILLATSVLVVSYRSYGRRQAEKYARYFVEVTHRPTYNRQPVITEDVQVVKIVRQTPLEIVFL